MNDHSVRDFQNAAYGFANAIGGMIEAMALYSQNQYRISRGETVAYDESSFQQIVNDRGLHHNSLMKQIYDR